MIINCHEDERFSKAALPLHPCITLMNTQKKKKNMHVTLLCLLHLSCCDNAFISAVINCEGQCQQAFQGNLQGEAQTGSRSHHVMLLTVATEGKKKKKGLKNERSCDNAIQSDRGQYSLTLSCHAKVLT